MARIIQRYDIINFLIEKYNYNSYLEIGIFHPSLCFDKIKLTNKIGVEPYPRADFPELFRGTSNTFFAQNKKTFDIIFVDGLHIDYQVLKDIKNSLKVLNTNGIILAHDCLPNKEEHQLDHQVTDAWCGNCWRAIAHLRCSNPNLEIVTLDTDCGVGVIKPGKQELYLAPKELNWKFYVENRINCLNVKSTFKWLEDQGISYDKTLDVWAESPFIKEII